MFVLKHLPLCRITATWVMEIPILAMLQILVGFHLVQTHDAGISISHRSLPGLHLTLYLLRLALRHPPTTRQRNYASFFQAAAE